MIRPILLLHFSKNRQCKTIHLCYRILVSLPKTVIVTYRLCTGFLNSTKTQTNSATHLACKMYHQTSFKTFNFLYTQLSNGVSSATTTLFTPIVVLIQCGSWKKLKISWRPSIQDYQNIIASEPMIFKQFILLFPKQSPTRKHYTSSILQTDGTSRYKYIVLVRDW